MIKERVLVSFGGTCPLKCKHCFAQENVLETGCHNSEDIVNSIREKRFDVIYVSHNNENFVKPYKGIQLCEQLYDTYKKDICVTTRCCFKESELQHIRALSNRMKKNGNILTFCFSIPAIASYGVTENKDRVPNPIERITCAKQMKSCGIQTLITLRPLFPSEIIPISELKEIIDISSESVDGYLSGGLVVTNEICNRLDLDYMKLKYINEKKGEYLEGIPGDFKYVDVEQEMKELEAYCKKKEVPFFRHSMDALNYFKSNIKRNDEIKDILINDEVKEVRV